MKKTLKCVAFAEMSRSLITIRDRDNNKNRKLRHEQLFNIPDVYKLLIMSHNPNGYHQQTVRIFANHHNIHARPTSKCFYATI